MLEKYFKHLKWDSSFFEYKIAQIKNNEITENTLSSVINFLKGSGYKLLVWKIPSENKNSFEFAKKNKGTLVDEKTTFTIQTDKIPTSFNYSEIIEYPYKEVNNELLNLALESGEFSRFKIDLNFKENEFEKLYTKWIERSVKKEIAEKVFVYLLNNKIIGMITLNKINGLGLIGLIAVNKDHRGLNIGKKLIQKAISYFYSVNVTSLEVVTQAKNKPACSFYEKCNFKVKEIECVFHFWL